MIFYFFSIGPALVLLLLFHGFHSLLTFLFTQPALPVSNVCIFQDTRFSVFTALRVCVCVCVLLPSYSHAYWCKMSKKLQDLKQKCWFIALDIKLQLYHLFWVRLFCMNCNYRCWILCSESIWSAMLQLIELHQRLLISVFYNKLQRFKWISITFFCSFVL